MVAILPIDSNAREFGIATSRAMKTVRAVASAQLVVVTVLLRGIVPRGENALLQSLDLFLNLGIINLRPLEHAR